MTIGGVIVSGNLVHDTVVHPFEHPVWGTTTWVESIETQIGGNGANTAYTLAKLGMQVRLLGMVGTDDLGDRTIATLGGVGVDTAGVDRSQGPTSATVVLVNRNGARNLLHRPGASAEAFIAPIEFSPGLTRDSTHYHMANIFGLPRMRPLAAENLRRAQAAGLTTSFDSGWDAFGEWSKIVEPALPFIDLLFVNEDEGRMLTGKPDPAEAIRIFQAQGCHDVVVKLGANGCLLSEGARQSHVPGFVVDAVDSTGAGDCFVGGFLAALNREIDFPSAARFANAVGALSVQRLGGVTGLLSYDETLQWMRAF